MTLAMTSAPIPQPALRPDAAAADAALHDLLEQSLVLPAEYGDSLSSHLPMALEALRQLGADAARLQSFATRYATRFRVAATPAPPPSNRQPQRGRYEDLAAWRQVFAAQLGSAGRDATLRAALPQLMPGVAAAAFHGLIRVGHAVRTTHDGELATALAYWASRFAACRADTVEQALTLEDWLAELALIARQNPGFGRGSLIATRMRHWAARADVQQVAGRLPATELPALALWAATQYSATRNFTILHVVTANAALRRLAAWLTATELAQAAPAMAAALLASGALSMHGPAAPATLQPADWPALVAAAIAQDDDHVIKLTLACRELDALMPDLAWRRAAARALAA